MTLTQQDRDRRCSRNSGRRRRHLAAARPRRSPGRSARRCWRWSPACRSRARRPTKTCRRLRDAGERCTALALDLEALVDRDSEAYELVVSAYRLPKGTDDEKAARARGEFRNALRAAIAAPLEVMRACGAGLALRTRAAGARQRERVERRTGGAGAAARGAAGRAPERRDQSRQREGSRPTPAKSPPRSPGSVNLVQQALPARLREEVGDD